MFTVVVASVFPVYFAKVVAEDGASADRDLSLATAVALACAAVLGPIVGAVADVRPWKKRLLASFQAGAVLSTAALALMGKGDGTLALVLFGVANVGASTAFVLYDALLPHVARDEELDRVSTAGYALGYLGGGIALALVFAAVQSPSAFGFEGPGAATRAGFLLVAVWWVVFSLPLFRRVREPVPETAGGGAGAASPVARLRETFRELRKYPDALTLMCAFLLYNDGIGAIIRLAAVVGEQRRFGETTLFGSILAVQFVGIPFAFLFGAVAGRIGAKRSIFVALAVYGVVTVLAARMTTETEFWCLALLVGAVQGGAQALSRSLFASMVPRSKSAEFFGLFGVFERFAGILGPLVFGLLRAAGFGTETAALSLLPFFAAGALLLRRVDVARGRAAAG
jgi:UMF1 family MFS transporter